MSLLFLGGRGIVGISHLYNGIIDALHYRCLPPRRESRLGLMQLIDVDAIV